MSDKRDLLFNPESVQANRNGRDEWFDSPERGRPGGRGKLLHPLRDSREAPLHAGRRPGDGLRPGPGLPRPAALRARRLPQHVPRPPVHGAPAGRPRRTGGLQPADQVPAGSRRNRRQHPLDLPTIRGYNSDDPEAEGNVGDCGAAVDSIRDIDAYFKDIDLGKVSTSIVTHLPEHERRHPRHVLRRGRAAGHPHRPGGRDLSERLHHGDLRGQRPGDPAAGGVLPACSATSWNGSARTCRAGTPSATTATTCARRAPTPSGGGHRHRQRHRHGRGADQARDAHRRLRARACRSSGTCTTTSSRRSPSAAPAARSGTRS